MTHLEKTRGRVLLLLFSRKPCEKENGGVEKTCHADSLFPLIRLRNHQNIQKTKRDSCGLIETMCSFFL